MFRVQAPIRPQTFNSANEPNGGMPRARSTPSGRANGHQEAPSSRRSKLPPRVRVHVERILDREARRLLDEQLDRDAVDATAGGNDGALDDRSD